MHALRHFVEHCGPRFVWPLDVSQHARAVVCPLTARLRRQQPQSTLAVAPRRDLLTSRYYSPPLFQPSERRTMDESKLVAP